jgi:transposase
MITNPETLPDDPVALKRMMVELCEQHGQQISQLNSENTLLHEQIRLLRQLLFGKKSEKLPANSTTVQLPLFDLPEPEYVEPAKVTVEAHDRKKSGRKPLPPELPRVEIMHDLPEEEKICACGCALSRIGEEVSEQLDVVPAKIQVLRHIRPKYACRACEGVEDDGPTVRIAPVVPQIIPKSIVSPGLLAHVLTGKFVDHLPFYRQEKLFARLGVDIGRATLSNWAVKAAEACMPLINLIHDEILDGRLINIDETTLQVLAEPGRAATSTSYMWLFRRGDPVRPALIYQYHPTRAGDVAKSFLGDYKGFVQTDGYSGYGFLDHQAGVRHAGCWAHARRKFMEVIRAQGKNRKSGSADQALATIQQLYGLEKEARRLELKPAAVLAMRQEKARPILASFHQWLLKRSAQTPPKGLLGKAVNYALNQWDRLVVYLEEPLLTQDNNLAENGIRPFVLGRKNWLFAGTPKGAEASAALYSLIETAKANNCEPYSYLRHIFERLPHTSAQADYEALLPWNVNRTRIMLDGMGGMI